MNRNKIAAPTDMRKFIELQLARWALTWIPNLSRPRLLRLAKFLGAAAYYASPHLRNVGFANLAIAFPRASQSERRCWLKASFQNFALVMLDAFWFSKDSASRLAQWVRFDSNMDRVFQNKAQICVTAHLGNWEVVGSASAQKGFPLVSVAAPLANAGVDALLRTLRERTGQQIVSKHGVLRSLIRTLKAGGKIALLLDQNTKPSEGGIWMDYFGLPVPVSPAADALHERTGAEVLFGFCIPQEDGSYIASAPDVLAPADVVSEPMAATRAILRATERLVRQHPSCWLWTYKRWKYIAPGHAAAEYPFYAKQATR